MHAARLAALQQVYSAAVPKELAKASTVGYEAQGTLVLLASSGAVAARLRHLAPRLLLTIQKQFAEVKAIRTEVQLVHRSKQAPGPKRRVGATGVRNLRELEARLLDAPLRHAVRRLIQHQTEPESAEGVPSNRDD